MQDDNVVCWKVPIYLGARSSGSLTLYDHLSLRFFFLKFE